MSRPVAICSRVSARLLGQVVGVGPCRAVAQRWPHDEVDGQADDHADGGVQQPTCQQVRLADRRWWRVRRSRWSPPSSTPPPASGAVPSRNADGQHHAHAERADAEQAARGPREEDPEEGRARSAVLRARRCGRRSRARPAPRPRARGRVARARARRSRRPRRSPRPARSWRAAPSRPPRRRQASAAATTRADVPPRTSSVTHTQPAPMSHRLDAVGLSRALRAPRRRCGSRRSPHRPCSPASRTPPRCHPSGSARWAGAAPYRRASSRPG